MQEKNGCLQEKSEGPHFCPFGQEGDSEKEKLHTGSVTSVTLVSQTQTCYEEHNSLPQAQIIAHAAVSHFAHS